MNLDKEANTDHPRIGIVRVYLECIRLKYVCSKHVHLKHVFEILTQNARCKSSGHSMYHGTYFSTTSRIFHRTCLGADAAGDALGSRGRVLNLHQHAERTCFLALAAADAELLVDRVDALGVLGDRAVLAGLRALAALNADHGLGRAVALDDLKTCLGRVKFLVERLGASADALETCHALGSLFNGQLFHN